MSAIDEMYEKFGVRAHPLGCTNEDVIEDSTGFVAQNICEGDCLDCTWYDPDEYYPDFSAEKQLEIIKALIRFDIPIYLTNLNQKYCIANLVNHNSEANLFEMALAIFLLKIYNRLNAKEKQEVKEILER